MGSSSRNGETPLNRFDFVLSPEAGEDAEDRRRLMAAVRVSGGPRFLPAGGMVNEPEFLEAVSDCAFVLLAL